MSVIKDLRRSVGVTQAGLAACGGTSQPTVAAYETGSKSPTLSTLERLAAAVGRSVVVSFVPALTREDRRSLSLHRAIADKLLQEPAVTLKRAGRNLERMTAQHPGAAALLEEWKLVLHLPVGVIAEFMVDPRLHVRDLRQVTPFAGVLTASERARVYHEFAEQDSTG
jgi:transcriptional regulator with XRE-family HTH domain